MAARIAFAWYQVKTFIEHAIAFSDDALHVLMGVILLIVLSAMTRRSLASFLPWLAVFGLELANEAVDLWVERWPVPAEQYGEGMKDILLTMALPTLLLTIARWRPRWLTGRT